MEEIQVGEYVRDCDGFIVKVNEIQDYKEEDDIWYQEKTLKGTWKSMVVKHSKNIIDLIEVGDYVNGKKIEHILETSIKVKDIAEKILCFETDFPIQQGLRCYHNCDIKSIVTHEQFASMEYKVGE